MPRESIEERRARLMPGARWLRAQREQRGWTGTELARRMGTYQERVSAYERAQDQPPADFARKLAEVLVMPEVQVWRCLGLPLPAELESDEAVIAWAEGEDKYSGVLRRVEGALGDGDPGPTQRHPVDKPRDVTREGDSDPPESQPGSNAV